MDIKLKHRLVGACVILALAVFFLPMILDSEKYRQDIETQIPTDSVLQQGVSESGEHINSAQTGSLTINLDEDEPVKAIKEPSQKTLDPIKSDSKVSEPEKPAYLKVDSSLDESTTKINDQSVSNAVKKTVDPSVEPTTATNKTDSSQRSKPINSTETDGKTKQPNSKTATSNTSDSKATSATDTTSENKSQKVKANDAAAKKPSFEETAWVIQIGSFSNKDNATALVSELRNKGYRAYQRNAGKFSRVYVGPYPDKSAAESRVETLEDIVGAKVKVLQFDPQGH